MNIHILCTYIYIHTYIHTYIPALWTLGSGAWPHGRGETRRGILIARTLTSSLHRSYVIRDCMGSVA